MQTIIRKVDENCIDEMIMKEAGALLKQGALVAFPTETVYGLGANALDSEAAAKIYAAKGRPSDNPLIVHIADMDALPLITAEIPEAAKKLAADAGAVVVISGETDYITNGTEVYTVEGGNPIMTSVTGMGCTATALVGAFAAVESDPMVAATAAMAVMSLAGERAAANARGNGSMQMHFLDELYNLTPETL